MVSLQNQWAVTAAQVTKVKAMTAGDDDTGDGGETNPPNKKLS